MPRMLHLHYREGEEVLVSPIYLGAVRVDSKGGSDIETLSGSHLFVRESPAEVESALDGVVGEDK